MPAASPAAIKLQYRALKCCGNFRKAALRDVPTSTSLRILRKSSPSAGFGLPRATMSNDCNKGTPAFIMVASCRVNMAMSLTLIVALLRSTLRRCTRLA